MIVFMRGRTMLRHLQRHLQQCYDPPGPEALCLRHHLLQCYTALQFITSHHLILHYIALYCISHRGIEPPRLRSPRFNEKELRKNDLHHTAKPDCPAACDSVMYVCVYIYIYM